MSEIYGYIYEVGCLVNNKFYIGQHKGLYNPCYRGSGLLLRYAFKKYGLESFEKPVVLATAQDKVELNTLEIYWIAEYRRRYGRENIYNITKGGNGGDIINNLPNKEEIRQRMAKIKLGHVTSEETKRKIRESSLGKHKKGVPIPEYIRQKISKTLTGIKRKPFSKEHREKLSKSQKGIPKGPQTEEHIRNAKEAKRLKKLSITNSLGKE